MQSEQGSRSYVPDIYSFQNKKGDARITTYPVFPGIELAYYSVHMDLCRFGTEKKGNFLEIHYCREGRMEQRQKAGCIYLMPGDVSVMVKEQCFGEYSFPLCHYHGISISIDMDRAPECLSCFLDDVNVRPAELAKKLCTEGNGFLIRSKESMEHIFSELYEVSDSYKKGYFKVKILELLLVLSGIDPSENKAFSHTLSKMQMETAKEAAVYLSENMGRTVTVAELAEKYHVSQTHLQNAFKGVYGVPVSSYLRVLKMQSAALRLIHTDRSVLEVAGEFGYDNAGKFASAFRKIMGETPTEYRRNHHAS